MKLNTPYIYLLCCILATLGYSRIVSRPNPTRHKKTGDSRHKSTFRWRSCGKNPMVSMKSLSMTPDPLVLPAILNVTHTAELNEKVGNLWMYQYVLIKLTLKKRDSVTGKFRQIGCYGHSFGRPSKRDCVFRTSLCDYSEARPCNVHQLLKSNSYQTILSESLMAAIFFKGDYRARVRLYPLFKTERRLMSCTILWFNYAGLRWPNSTLSAGQQPGRVPTSQGPSSFNRTETADPNVVPYSSRRSSF